MSFAVAMSSFFPCQLSDSWYHVMECSVLNFHTYPKRNLGKDQHSWGAVISQTKGVILGH